MEHKVRHRVPVTDRSFSFLLLRLKTSVLNEWLGEVAAARRLAKFSSAVIQRIKFLSQTKIRPPTFCLRVSGRTPLTNVDKRTVVNALRQGFDFQGTSMYLRLPLRALVQAGVPLRIVVKYSSSWEQSKKHMEAKRQRIAGRSP